MLYPIEEYAWAAAQVRQVEARRLRLVAEARDGSARTLRSHLARTLVSAGVRLDRRAAVSARSPDGETPPPSGEVAAVCCE